MSDSTENDDATPKDWPQRFAVYALSIDGFDGLDADDQQLCIDAAEWARQRVDEQTAALRSRLVELTNERDSWVELEARLCPEDFGFEEYIAHLTGKAARLVELERAHDALRQDAERRTPVRGKLIAAELISRSPEIMHIKLRLEALPKDFEIWTGATYFVTFECRHDAAARLSDTPHEAPAPTEPDSAKDTKRLTFLLEEWAARSVDDETGERAYRLEWESGWCKDPRLVIDAAMIEAEAESSGVAPSSERSGTPQ